MSTIDNFNSLGFTDRVDLICEHADFLLRTELRSSNGRLIIIHLYSIATQLVEVWFNTKYKPYVVRMLAYHELDRFIYEIDIRGINRSCL